MRYCVVSRKKLSSGAKYTEMLQCFVGPNAKAKAERYAKHERFAVHPKGSRRISVKKW